jgi:hypothetical protein
MKYLEMFEKKIVDKIVCVRIHTDDFIIYYNDKFIGYYKCEGVEKVVDSFAKLGLLKTKNVSHIHIKKGIHDLIFGLIENPPQMYNDLLEYLQDKSIKFDID